MFTLRIHPLQLTLPGVRTGIAHLESLLDPGLRRWHERSVWHDRVCTNHGGDRSLNPDIAAAPGVRSALFAGRRSRNPRFHGAHENLFMESAMEREMHRL